VELSKSIQNFSFSFCSPPLTIGSSPPHRCLSTASKPAHALAYSSMPTARSAHRATASMAGGVVMVF